MVFFFFNSQNLFCHLKPQASAAKKDLQITRKGPSNNHKPYDYETIWNLKARKIKKKKKKKKKKISAVTPKLPKPKPAW